MHILNILVVCTELTAIPSPGFSPRVSTETFCEEIPDICPEFGC